MPFPFRMTFGDAMKVSSCSGHWESGENIACGPCPVLSLFYAISIIFFTGQVKQEPFAQT